MNLTDEKKSPQEWVAVNRTFPRPASHPPTRGGRDRDGNKHK
jgi:hypothetical protein